VPLTASNYKLFYTTSACIYAAAGAFSVSCIYLSSRPGKPLVVNLIDEIYKATQSFASICACYVECSGRSIRINSMADCVYALLHTKLLCAFISLIEARSFNFETSFQNFNCFIINCSLQFIPSLVPRAKYNFISRMTTTLGQIAFLYIYRH
jgi:hypothetical protein